MQWDSETEAVWLATANSELRSEVLALKQEIERLRAAGDALAEAAVFRAQSYVQEATAAWKEARRGQ